MAGRPKGLPRTGGRKPGTPNRVTADVRALAQQYGAQALETLFEIMKCGQQPAAARVSAAKELLDRGYGKAPQPVEGGAPAATNDDLVQALVQRLRA